MYMKSKKRVFNIAIATALLLTGCAGQPTTVNQMVGATSLTYIDESKWNYNAENDVYWQVQIQYCENPVDPDYETLGIFVPAAYMNATENKDGTYTCVVNTDNEVSGYTAATAPIVIPVNTPGYAAMRAPTDYAGDASAYTSEGFVYVNAGCRGRDSGAPAGVTDLKAAVRYIRYNEDVIPGSIDRIFTFGMSGGGAQSALMGATGDSDLYAPYLDAIGAVQGYSDAVAGSMCWCPITNLDYANEAYEWNMGSTRTGLSDEMQSLSDGMANAFAAYINKLKLTDSEGNVLFLTESENGIYQAGSYYEYIKSVIEQSLNNFLSDTTFPYTSGSTGAFGTMGGRGGMGNRGDGGDFHGGMGGNRGDMSNGNFKRPDGALEGYVDSNGRLQDDGINRDIGKSNQTERKTYQTIQEYIDDLNADGKWINYDSQTNSATIISLEAFVEKCKTASKSVGAFDDLNGTQGENTLFGYGNGSGAHFDPVMAELLVGTEYEAGYVADLAKTDALGNTVDTRVDMYNPMYYLASYYEGYQTANVAAYWRIRTGINQGDTALSTEVNLALALETYGSNVDFETVWGQGHTMAERTGSSTENFIQWINDCLK